MLVVILRVAEELRLTTCRLAIFENPLLRLLAAWTRIESATEFSAGKDFLSPSCLRALLATFGEAFSVLLVGIGGKTFCR